MVQSGAYKGNLHMIEKHFASRLQGLNHILKEVCQKYRSKSSNNSKLVHRVGGWGKGRVVTNSGSACFSIRAALIHSIAQFRKWIKTAQKIFSCRGFFNFRVLCVLNNGFTEVQHHFNCKTKLSFILPVYFVLCNYCTV